MLSQSTWSSSETRAFACWFGVLLDTCPRTPGTTTSSLDADGSEFIGIIGYCVMQINSLLLKTSHVCVFGFILNHIWPVFLQHYDDVVVHHVHNGTFANPTQCRNLQQPDLRCRTNESQMEESGTTSQCRCTQSHRRRSEYVHQIVCFHVVDATCGEPRVIGFAKMNMIWTYMALIMLLMHGVLTN